MKYEIEEVVKSQSEASEHQFILEQELKDEDDKAHQIALKVEIGEYKRLHETPVLLKDCILPKVALVRVRRDCKEKMKWMKDDAHSNFVLIGEVMQAPNHVVLLSAETGTIYQMVHSIDLEVVPPQEC